MTTLAIFFLILTILSGLALVVSIFFLFRGYFQGRNKLAGSLGLKLFKVTLPKAGIKQEEKTQESIQLQREVISVVEQFLSGTNAIAREKKSALKDLDHLAFEITSIGEEIQFFIAVPTAVTDLIEKQLHSVYSQAVIEEADEYNIHLPKIGHAEVARLKLKKGYEWPIRTYQQIESDPLNVITNTLSKIGKDEAATVQVVFKPANGGWQKKGDALAKNIQEGKQGLGGKKFGQQVKDVLKTKKPNEPQQPKTLTPLVEESVRAIENKASKTGFRVNVRIIASSGTPEGAKIQVRNIVAAFDQFASPNLNSFMPTTPKTKEDRAALLAAITFRTFSEQNSFILSSEELGSFMHLPDSRFVLTPSIDWLGARTAPAPAKLPKEGRLIGHNVYRGVKRPFKLPAEDRRKHFYLIGKTGTGKTTMFLNMIRKDIEEGHGVAFLDPHGDAIEQILQTIPKSRIDDVVLFRPGDTQRPMGLNMLEYDSEDLKDFVVGEMIAIFYKLFPPEIIGPMFEHNMRNVMLTLMEDKENPGTIAEIPRMFSDERYQRHKASKVKDQAVRSFWENEMAQTTDFHKSEMLGYLISKVGRFVENSMMRNIIGQTRSAFNFRDIMDGKKIFLANLSKGEMGDINSNLIGMILVTKIQMAALSRVDTPEKERKDFYLYIDEFQNFTTDSIPTILSEARKYRLNLNIAHQFVSQVKEDIRDAIFGNVGTICSYRLGAQDAQILEKEFEPVFNSNDIVNLSFAQAYIKATTERSALPAFSLEIPAPMEVSNPVLVRPKVGDALKQLSRLKYGRDRGVVEREILERGKIQ